MKKNIQTIVIIGIMMLSNLKINGQANVLSHSRVNTYYVGWDNTGSSGALDIRNDFSGSGQDINFSTNGSQKATILNGGNFGIGIGAPVFKLDVNGDIRMPSGTSGFSNALYIRDSIVLRESYLTGVGASSLCVGTGAGTAIF